MPTRTAAIACVILLALAGAPLQASAQAREPTDRGEPIVIGQAYRLASRVMGDVRTVTVHLPEHYAEPDRRFPVLVLLDGGAREDFHHITGLAEINAAYGQGRELIVVGVEGVDRKRDLTSPSTVAEDLKAAPTSGGAARYRRFLVEELKPWIAARYRTSGETALMGESLAGLFTLETLLTSPTSFDDYVIVSPSLWWRRGALVGEAAADLNRGDLRGRRAWLAFDEPAPPAAQAAIDRARQDRLTRRLRAARRSGLWFRADRPGEGHGSIYHPAAVKALRALYGSSPASSR